MTRPPDEGLAMMGRFLPTFGMLFLGSLVLADDSTPVERGKTALLTKPLINAFWPASAYQNAWKTWGLKDKPADYPAAFRARYGLAPADYPNDGYPMGLRKANLLIGSGIGIDCMTCHGGSVLGKSYVGLGNASLDIQALFEELGAAGGSPGKTPFVFSHVRGTNEAGAFSVYLLGMRKPDLSLTPNLANLGLRDDSCEDVPAWWLLKKKRTMYHVGATDARSVRSLMQFLMHPLTTAEDFTRHESTFRDIQKYLLSLEAPKYPFPVDRKKAEAGKVLFESNCASCHGTYGEKWTYPNRIVPLAEIGTDPARYHNIGPKFAEAYNRSWFAAEGGRLFGGYPVRETRGYQAPPLDGIWATAPYFHNGSVPTLAAVLNSKLRPVRFVRTFNTAEEDYDKKQIGWKVSDPPADSEKLPALERRKIYDTTKPGRGNGGHTYGDSLSDPDRLAVLEYLKTL